MDSEHRNSAAVATADDDRSDGILLRIVVVRARVGATLLSERELIFQSVVLVPGWCCCQLYDYAKEPVTPVNPR